MNRSKNILAAAIILVAFAGCPSDKPVSDKSTVKKNEGLKILATFLPMYILTLNVVEGVEGVEVNILLPPEGAGPHGYHMTPGDMKKLAGADVLVMNGHNLDNFVGSPEKTNPGIKIILTTRGMETLSDIELDENHADDDGHKGNDHGPVNPHLWVSPRNAAMQVRNIAGELAKIDPEHAQVYGRNAESFAEELLKLEGDFKIAVASFQNKKIVTVHNVFDYLAADIGLEVIAVLRVDPTSGPRSRELARIADKIKAEKPAAIFVEPQFSEKLARVLSEETGVPVYTLDPVATGEPRSDYYIEVMRANLRTLIRALGNK